MISGPPLDDLSDKQLKQLIDENEPYTARSVPVLKDELHGRQVRREARLALILSGISIVVAIAVAVLK